MEKTWRSIGAGILDIVAAVLILYVALRGLGIIPMVFYLDDVWSRFTWCISPIIAVVFAILGLIGGIFALKRKKWGLALIGSVSVWGASIYFGTMSSFYMQGEVFLWLGILALMLIAISRKEFA